MKTIKNSISGREVCTCGSLEVRENMAYFENTKNFDITQTRLNAKKKKVNMYEERKSVQLKKFKPYSEVNGKPKKC